MNESGKFVLRISPKLHAELKRLARQKNISLNQAVLDRLTAPVTSDPTAPIKEYFGDSLIGIVLFGSVARAEQRESSDIDLLIVLDQKIEIERNLYKIWDDEILNKIGGKYSPQFSHLPKIDTQVSSLWLESSLEGEVLYDSTGALRKVVSGIKNQIASGKYLRRMTYGHPYWICQGENSEQPKFG